MDYPKWLLVSHEWNPPERIVPPKNPKEWHEALRYRVRSLLRRKWSMERIAKHLGYQVPFLERLMK